MKHWMSRHIAVAALLASAVLVSSPPAWPCTTHSITTPDEDDSALQLTTGSDMLVEPVAGPFDVPWSFAFLPDGSYLVTERPGHLDHVFPSGEKHEIGGVPLVHYHGHGGLLDVALDPGFASNSTIYFSYLQGTDTSSTVRVMKATLDLDDDVLDDGQIIFESTPGARDEMIGGRIVVTPAGYLFLSLGDRWDRRSAQDVTQDSGTIIRIRTDGSIPPDNPFAGVPGARTEIWSYGNRNPQGLALDPASGELWEHEHGPRGGDEVNLIHPGVNYGWPVTTYGIDYTGETIAVPGPHPDMQEPVHYWVPLSIAPSGLAVEDGPAQTNLWIGALAGEKLVELTLENDCVVSEQHFLDHEIGRIRDVRINADGELFVLTDGGNGMLYRLPRASDAIVKAHL